MPILAILTSGGDAPGMNSVIVAAAKTAFANGWRVIGIEDGYNGLIEGRFIELNPSIIDDESRKGGTFLRSARSKAFRTVEGRTTAARNLLGVDALLVIGGNGSLTGAKIFGKEHGIRVIGVPASIDNDIACTSMSVGVDTALNTIVEACDRISDTARSHRRAFIVEVMGRECGYLAMASAISCSADAVIFREQGKSEDQLISELRNVIRHAYSAMRNKKRVLIIKAEGVEVPTASLAARLETTLQEDSGGATLRYTILGHVVRGGSPSSLDRLMGARFGYAAFHAALRGKDQVMLGWRPEDTTKGTVSIDKNIYLFDLEHVLTETVRLLDGSHPSTQARIAMMRQIQGILPL
ncbi:MAG: 6-phosphofructokinase [Myxococcota bacterium]|nr:6-phosphofructokinase [Myxococcota bacterium]